MPAGDRTGPLGMGPLTGRAAGFCAGYSGPGYANPMPGRGRGCGGRGGGRGWRHQFQATGLPGWARAGMAPAAPVAEPPLAALKQQAEYLGNALAEVRKRIEVIEAKSTET